MVHVLERTLLEQQSSACGLPGSSTETRPSHPCPEDPDVRKLRLLLVVLCVLFGLLCLLLI
uniref:BNLF2a n=1 Tax=Epstein-Barr virus (strain GD1) TaxID=10376 RepID=G8IFR2_EBVG|nr:BNLF2a [human gammaherpesvirus 4]